MKLRIEIELDNAAFANGTYSAEVQRVLTTLVTRLPLYPYVGPNIDVYDSNGNRVGYARIMQGIIHRT